jgi:hypothetical protein
MKRYQKLMVTKFVTNNFLYGNLTLVCSAFGGEHWYLRVRKIKENTLKSKIDINKSLKLTPQEVDINSPRLKTAALEVLAEIKSQHYKECDEIFYDEDMRFLNRQMSLGRISEDKFKNLMMHNGYEVLKPVEDIWGYDFIVKIGKIYETVQCKCTARLQKHFSIQNKKGIPYKSLVSHMAFIHLPSSEVYYVPTQILPDTTKVRLDDSYLKYKVGLSIDVE